RHGPCGRAAIRRDADVPHAGVLVEDLDDLADVFPEERLAPRRQQEHEAALAHARRDLVDLLEAELLLTVHHRRLFPAGMRAVREEAVLTLRVARVGDEVDEVHGQLAAFPEELLPVLQVVEVSHASSPRGRSVPTAERIARNPDRGARTDDEQL